MITGLVCKLLIVGIEMYTHAYYSCCIIVALHNLVFSHLFTNHLRKQYDRSTTDITSTAE